ncbi:dephospho-CoA kinase [Ornithinimicrobium sediminis]|uniref:dephospho-CoA kinase n=1 Tax=Ornithinimicrobium sediminis TaxID=2904603 RepID=UPI001E55966C|nr:dephospho-CoA kinase [Ornithinimicrobium sediminis]MCE0488228.1 dephospho-CoA kinase [Ornithinimicrobium sediminis]
MLRVGLSGGIGSGKSTVSARLAEHGAVVVDADRLAREVVAAGSAGLAQVVARFGTGVVAADGTLDRATLGEVVFGDPQARRDLEAITHPRIARRTAELVAAAPADAVVVHDVPLLVEKDMGAAYHLVVIVGVGEQERLRRLVDQRGMDPQQARSRIDSQADDTRRRAAADVWLDNHGTVEELERQVDLLWGGRLVPFEHNVRHRVAVRVTDRLPVDEADPTWPAQAARLSARLRRALGETAVAVEHVGSTAVPGMPAQDVIDLQVVVPALAAVDQPEVATALADAGFPPYPGRWRDTVPGRDGPATWDRRVHGHSDPGRPARVHIRPVGSPARRLAVLLRDWATADPRAHADVAATWEPWPGHAVERAEAWAQATGWRLPQG